MTLVPGTKLGPYEILATIEAGGMGEVYCAIASYDFLMGCLSFGLDFLMA
jgi:hypothetical protein